MPSNETSAARVQTLMTGLAFGESPRWHMDHLWFCNWVAQEVIAVDLMARSDDPANYPGGAQAPYLLRFDAEGGETKRTVWPFALGFFDRVRMLAACCERPYRLNVNWLPAEEAPIRPLLDQLRFTRTRKPWGYQLRLGFFEICVADMEIIAKAMRTTLPKLEHDYPRTAALRAPRCRGSADRSPHESGRHPP